MADTELEFTISFRKERDHDHAVRSAYRLLAQLIEALPAGTSYGIDNEEESRAPFIYVVSTELTKERFAEIVDNAQQCIQEDEAILDMVHTVAKIIEEECNLIDSGAEDAVVAQRLAQIIDHDHIRVLMDEFPYADLAARITDSTLARFMGVLAEVRKQTALRPEVLPLAEEELAALEAVVKPPEPVN